MPLYYNLCTLRREYIDRHQVRRVCESKLRQSVIIESKQPLRRHAKEAKNGLVIEASKRYPSTHRTQDHEGIIDELKN